MYTDTGVGGTGQMSDASIQGGSPGLLPPKRQPPYKCSD